MASKTRGAIEEHSVSFSNESSKVIEFQGATVQTRNFPSPPAVKLISVDGSGSDEGNANIHVSFTNVTTTGMTILLSARFTGTIRYLCSVQG